MFKLKNSCNLFCFLILIPLSSIADDLQQITKTWLGIDLSGGLYDSQNWEYDLNSQARYDFTNTEYQLTRNEIGLGYQIYPTVSAWAGYTWEVRNANLFQENRPWEQIIWDIAQQDNLHFSSRTRFEERKRTDDPEWTERLRQRFTLSFPKAIAHTITPVLYDEIFFYVHNAPWTESEWFNQNRLFVGIEFPLLIHTSLQVGYINQFLWRTQTQRDELNHILWVNLNIKTA